MAKVMDFRVVIAQDEDGFFVVSVPSLPGCHTQGKTYEEAIKNAKEAIELCLEEVEESLAYRRKVEQLAKLGKSEFIGIVNVPVRIA